MQLSRSRLFAVILALGAAQGAARADVNRWARIGPPSSDPNELTTIHSITVDSRSPRTLYAGAVGTIWKSTDAGRSWTSAPTPLTRAAQVRAIVIDPTDSSIVYAAGIGVSKSRDGGTTWTAMYSGMSTIIGPDELIPSTTSLAIDFLSPSILYAGGGRGVFRSTDGGATWQARRDGLPPHTEAIPNIVWGLVIDPDHPSTLYAGLHTAGVFKSTDGGLNWSAANSGLNNFGVVALAIDRQSPNRLYAGTLDGGVYRTLDGGASWTPVLAPQQVGLLRMTVPELVFDPFSPRTAYAGTSTGNLGVFQTTDGGETWHPFNDGLPETHDFRALTVDPTSPSKLYAGLSDGGIFAITLAEPCAAGSDTLCLNGGRFRVRVNWRASALGTHGVGEAVPLTADTGHFWFFSRNNIELIVKVVDGRGFNGRFWVFYGALSDVEYTIQVTDGETGEARTYFNPQGRLASVADTAAFAATGGSDLPSPASLTKTGASSTAVVCSGDPTTLCLNGDRFRVRAAWRAVNLGTSGQAQAMSLTSDTGYFWFFSSNNVELVIKVVDGRAFNDHFWVFYGALSDVEYTITVTDTETGSVRTYFNPQGQLASVADTAAF